VTPDFTYLVVPAEHEDELVVRVGTGREAVTDCSLYFAVVVGARPADVLAVWKFNGRISQAQAEEIAVQTAPTRLVVCVSEDCATLNLATEYAVDIEVIDVRPEVT